MSETREYWQDRETGKRAAMESRTVDEGDEVLPVTRLCEIHALLPKEGNQ